MMLHCFVDGEMSRFVVMVAMAKPSGCHVCMAHHPDDNDITSGYVCHVSGEPIPETKVQAYVVKIFERATRGHLFQWLDAFGCSVQPQEENPWKDDFEEAQAAGRRAIPSRLSLVE